MRVCVPVPLYHCFGSVVAGINMAVHGITLVFPSPGYNSQANLEAIQRERYGPLLITRITFKYTTLCTSIDSCVSTQGVILFMALPRCSSTCSSNRIYTSMMCHQLKLVIEDFDEYNMMNVWYWTWWDVEQAFEASLFMCCCVEGIMGGSPCPSEIVTKLKTVMNMKEIMVSGYVS